MDLTRAKRGQAASDVPRDAVAQDAGAQGAAGQNAVAQDARGRSRASSPSGFDREHARAVVSRGGRAKWWRRVGSRERAFQYVDAQGSAVTAEAEMERIRRLALPPAWTDVRIAPSQRSRLQAVGIDAAGRVQYRYRAEYAAKRQQIKFERIERFGLALPALRRAINADLAADGLHKRRVVALVVRLMNDLYFRLGSQKSVRTYRTYGATTLLKQHIRIDPGGVLQFNFIGKHHIRQRRILTDESVAELISDLKKLRGVRLFQCIDELGRIHPVLPADVNHYIKVAAGAEFCAKDFRTWGGSLLAAEALARLGTADSESKARQRMVAAARLVAERLGNTPTVCRNCYIHPLVFQRYSEGITIERYRPRAHKRRHRTIEAELEPEEEALLELFCPDMTAALAA